MSSICRRTPAAVAGFVLLASLTAAAAAPLADRQEIPLWPGTAPGSENVNIQPLVVERSKTLFMPDRAITRIINPSLTAFVPEKPNGTSMIVVPGGAYARIVLDKEAGEIINWLRPLGITVFMLLHRLPAEGHVNGKDVPLQDGQRAVRLIRHHAAEWGLDPAKIGFMGFSAAGHLGASVVTMSGKSVYKPVDAIDQASARPDFGVLGYPVASMQTEIATGAGGTRDNLLGKTPSAEAIAEYSTELHVTSSTPQTFLVHADDDPVVPTEHSIRFYQALKKAGVASELHIFRNGNHGFGIDRVAGTPTVVWPELCTRWMIQIGVLKVPAK
jgi:acetyl esterase/lipase